MPKLYFQNKALTLRSLSDKLDSARVLPLETISWSEFNDMDDAKLKARLAHLGNELIIRSSCTFEDSHAQSNAGAFLSVFTNISDNLKSSILDVFLSYKTYLNEHEIVLIQPSLPKIKHCGVLFSKVADSGAPYYVVENDSSGATDSVTSGNKIVDTYYIRRKLETIHDDVFYSPIIKLAIELEHIFENENLDLEYAIDTNDQLWLLQVRPLIVKPNTSNNINISHVIEKAKSHFTNLSIPSPIIHGKKSIFGIMPDWNPAEIIGVKPKPLSLSLYKELVTDSTWAYQRDNYGYKNLRSFPLLIDFFGLPYIDVRVSFNSFLPKNLPNSLCDKLVEHYIEQLETQPNNHDKVEFEIVQSCYTFDIHERLLSMKSKGFTDEELSTLKEHLLALTNQIINPRSGLWIQDLHKIEKLKERQKKILSGIDSKEAQIYWLLEDCKRYGTLPFAGLARAGFIAVQLLNSMVNKSLLCQKQVDTFLNSLTTVSGQMSEDFNRMPLDSFLTHYGHLRPGTYEITSPRYDSQDAQYFSNSTQTVKSKSAHEVFDIDSESYVLLNEAIQEHNLSHSVDSLFHFIRSAIEGREYAKFIFSKSLSDALELFASLGAQYGYSREELSFANINIIYNAYSSADDFETLLRNSIKEGKKRYNLAQQIHLPPLITSLSDFDFFKSPELKPNYITQKTILSDVVSGDLTEHDLTGKIVMIKSADPGYDWIFSHSVAGFITAYGGCNSHMAIRANEMGIPAVIGIGEEKFKELCKANKIEISCASEQLRTIQ
ncbi:PEP-utilizing enzyme [Pseudoalteromonas gelatinilytica]